MTGRRGVTALTLIVLMGLLVAGAFVGWRALSSPLPGEDDATTSSCDAVDAGDVVRTADVTVSVYNAGTRTGLASETQRQLVARGFIAGEIGNAPEDLPRIRFVRIFTSSKQDPAARLVALQFGKSTRVAVAPDLGPGIEVVVGNRFIGLSPAPRTLKAATDATGC